MKTYPNQSKAKIFVVLAMVILLISCITYFTNITNHDIVFADPTSNVITFTR